MDSEVDSDFIAGLKDLGLFDEGMAESKPRPKTEKKKKKKKLPQSRGRTPQRKPLNIDALLDESDFSEAIPKEIDEDSDVNQIQTTISQNIQSNNHKDDFSLQSSIERNIIEYLQHKLNLVSNDFTNTIKNSLQDNSSIDEIIYSFIESIRQMIRDEIIFTTDQNKFSQLAVDTIDPFGMKFRDLFNRIETIKTNNSEDKIKKINCLKEDIRSCTQSIQTQLTHETLSNQFNELNKIRNKLKESTKKNSARARQCLYAQIELECKRESQKEETEKIKQKFDEIENERSNIFENDGENDLSKIETISGYVNDLKYYLSSSETTTKNYDISKQYQSLREIRNDLDSLSDKMTDQNNQILLSTASQAKWSSSFQPISLPNEYSYHPIERPNTGPFYLEEMRRKLRDVQDIRMSNLENTSKFLTSLRRKEAKRAHDQKTKIAYSDGSYFSPYE